MGFLTILEFIKCLFANDASDDDMDNDITSISKAKAKKSERIFSRFIARIPEDDLDDDELSTKLDNILERFFEGDVSNLSTALENAYQEWKKEQKEQKEQANRKRNNHSIIDVIKRFDFLSDKEKTDLFDYFRNFYDLDLSEEIWKGIRKIVIEWFIDRKLNNDKLKFVELVRYHINFVAKDFGIRVPDQNTPLNSEELTWQTMIFEKFSADAEDFAYCEEDYYEYVKRYYFNPENPPKPIECDDLIVNRPCYFKGIMQLETPHYHMGKCYYGDDTCQDVTVYLFGDNLEVLTDEGRTIVVLSKIIEMEFDDKLYENEGVLILKITDQNNLKLFLKYPEESEDDDEENTKTIYLSDMLKFKALMLYFIKHQQ